jgi:hypothetical protein
MPAVTGEKPTEPQGTVPRLSGKRYKEADQSGQKNQLSHRDRSFPSTGDERDLQTARSAKPAEPPDGSKRSPTCHPTRTGKDVHAARKRRLTTSGMSAGASAAQKRSRWN